MKAKIYSAAVKGVFTHVKAYKKVNAIARFKQLDPTIKAKDVSLLSGTNGQAPVEELYPEICK